MCDAVLKQSSTNILIPIYIQKKVIEGKICFLLTAPKNCNFAWYLDICDIHEQISVEVLKTLYDCQLWTLRNVVSVSVMLIICQCHIDVRKQTLLCSSCHKVFNQSNVLFG